MSILIKAKCVSEFGSIGRESCLPMIYQLAYGELWNMIRFHISELNRARQDPIYYTLFSTPARKGPTPQGPSNFALLFAGFGFARI